MTPTNKKIKLVKVEDTGSEVVQLTRGTWLVDGKEYTVDSYHGVEVVVGDATSLKFKKETTYKDYYINLEDQKITVEVYEDLLTKLRSKGYDDGDGETVFSDLDDEYEFKKFCRNWKCIYSTSVDWEVVEVEVSFVQLKTDNPFITSMYTTESCTSSESLLYVYNRNPATKDIVSKCFTSLGMVQQGDINYSATSNKKVWGNSNSSHLRNVVAFGTYIFDDSMPNVKGYNSTYKGTLDRCKALYQNDKETYEGVIKSKYATHFLKVPLGEILTGEVLSKLNTLLKHMNEVEVKQKYDTKFRSCRNTVSEMVKTLQETLASKTEESL